MSTLGWIWEGLTTLAGLLGNKVGIRPGPKLQPLPEPHEPVAGTTICQWCGVKMTDGYFTKPYCTRKENPVDA